MVFSSSVQSSPVQSGLVKSDLTSSSLAWSGLVWSVIIEHERVCYSSGQLISGYLFELPSLRAALTATWPNVRQKLPGQLR